MSETASTPPAPSTDPASGGDPPAAPAATGTPAPGSGGADPSADAFAEERTRWETQRREMQSQLDQARAQVEKLKPASSDPPAGLTAEQIRAEMRRAAEITAASASLREKFPHANPEVFKRVDEYDTVEAFTAAAEASHRSISELIAPAVATETKAIRDQYAARFGPLGETPAGTEGGTPGGDPTVEELNRMSIPELNALEKEKPGIVRRVLAAASSPN